MRIDVNDFPDNDCWYDHFVSYGETDCAGVLYYGEYLHIFERARSKYMRDRNLSYAEVEKRGIILPVRQACCRYVRPARYDELVSVRCAVSKVGRATMTFVYQMWGPPERSTLLAVGETELAATSQGRPVRVPDWLREIVEKAPRS